MTKHIETVKALIDAGDKALIVLRKAEKRSNCKNTALLNCRDEIDIIEEALKALVDEVKLYKSALERITSGEAFTLSFMAKDNKEWRELVALKDYAETVLKKGIS